MVLEVDCRARKASKRDRFPKHTSYIRKNKQCGLSSQNLLFFPSSDHARSNELGTDNGSNMPSSRYLRGTCNVLGSVK